MGEDSTDKKASGSKNDIPRQRMRAKKMSLTPQSWEGGKKRGKAEGK